MLFCQPKLSSLSLHSILDAVTCVHTAAEDIQITFVCPGNEVHEWNSPCVNMLA